MKGIYKGKKMLKKDALDELKKLGYTVNSTFSRRKKDDIINFLEEARKSKRDEFSDYIEKNIDVEKLKQPKLRREITKSQKEIQEENKPFDSTVEAKEIKNTEEKNKYIEKIKKLKPDYVIDKNLSYADTKVLYRKLKNGENPDEKKEKYVPSQDEIDTYVDGILDNTNKYTEDELRKMDYEKLLNLFITETGYNDGSGKKKMDDRGLSNFQIDKIMEPHKEYLGTISHDEIKSKILPLIKEKSKGCFVINTDPASKSGQHWQCIYFDATPNGDKEIDFYDSYADPIDPKLMKDIKLISDKLNSSSYLKFKENKIKEQSINSSNCGFFCISFLLDRLRGKKFKDITHFSDVINGEAKINRFKEQHGFGYLPSFGKGIVDTIKRIFFFPTNSLPSGTKKMFEKYKDTKINGITVCREPINQNVSSFLNVITLGQWNKAKKELNYDNMFHLFMVLHTDAGDLRLEKNQKIDLSRGGIAGESVKSPYGMNGNIVNLDTLMENTRKLMGDHSFYQYNAFEPSMNCQGYVQGTLKANGGWNEEMKNFVVQDAKTLLTKLPSFVGKLAQFTTDTRAKIQEVFGVGK